MKCCLLRFHKIGSGFVTVFLSFELPAPLALTIFMWFDVLELGSFETISFSTATTYCYSKAVDSLTNLNTIFELNLNISLNIQ